MARTRSTLYAISIAGGTALFVDQIVESSLAPGVTLLEPDPTDGLVDPQFVGLDMADPRINFTTTKLATVLAAMGIDGRTVDGEGHSLTFWLQAIQNLGSRKSGSNHVTYTMAKGLVIPTTLTAGDGGLATLGYQAIPISTDGLTHPLTRAASQALSGTPDADEGFVVGFAEINGTQIDLVQSANVNFGIEVEVKRGDGEPYMTEAYIKFRKPKIELVTEDTDILGTIPLGGLAITEAKLFLRKVDEGAGRVAEATAEHIEFTMTEGMAFVGDIASNPYQVPITFSPTKDSSNAILQVSTTAAMAA